MLFYITDNHITDSMMKLPLFLCYSDKMLSACLNGF